MEFQAPFRDVRIPRGTWGLWLVVVSLVLEIPGVAHAILPLDGIAAHIAAICRAPTAKVEQPRW